MQIQIQIPFLNGNSQLAIRYWLKKKYILNESAKPNNSESTFRFNDSTTHNRKKNIYKYMIIYICMKGQWTRTGTNLSIYTEVFLSLYIYDLTYSSSHIINVLIILLLYIYISTTFIALSTVRAAHKSAIYIIIHKICFASQKSYIVCACSTSALSSILLFITYIRIYDTFMNTNLIDSFYWNYYAFT